MSAFLILDVDIHDPEKYKGYMEKAKPLVDKYGGKYHVRGGPFEVIDGSWQPTRLVVIEYPDMASAKAMYLSEEYAPLKAIRESCSTGHTVIVDGYKV
ncbi:MAG: DUF1330 domain-containing protein [Kordiimonadaceae bacterium]|jgi:uncharacterized protein (DUF1330 family)|nr:DUF1330 domain-containing protein [Kordiimonadaceae bacterium]MBT6033265.1 DUF1330 domain-containing protein [Kordiimonadaceae bacterium]